jgi:thiol-disulfide isomerase/thioredoxin
MNDDAALPTNTEVSQRSTGAWPLFVLLLVAAGVLLAIQWRRPQPPNPFVGKSLPPIGAEGWLNSDRPPTLEDWQGEVVLVDFWATDCPTCLSHLPELAELYQRFRGHGLKIVGLTPESGDDAQRVKQFVEKQQIDWPIGYGAGFAFEMMGIEFTPTYVLYDRTGRSIWGGHSLDGLDEAAVNALAK